MVGVTPSSFAVTYEMEDNKMFTSSGMITSTAKQEQVALMQLHYRLSPQVFQTMSILSIQFLFYNFKLVSVFLVELSSAPHVHNHEQQQQPQGISRTKVIIDK